MDELTKGIRYYVRVRLEEGENSHAQLLKEITDIAKGSLDGAVGVINFDKGVNDE